MKKGELKRNLFPVYVGGGARSSICFVFFIAHEKYDRRETVEVKRSILAIIQFAVNNWIPLLFTTHWSKHFTHSLFNLLCANRTI